MLNRIKPKSLDVLSASLERKEALPVYNTIVNTITNSTIYERKNSMENSDYLYCIYDFPDYLKGLVTQKSWKLQTINTYKGSLILLKNYKNTDAYLKTKFSAARRSKFRTYQKRLETCFNIQYKTYFGAIDKADYESLFEAFYEMINKRFLEKKIQNYDLLRWHIYQEIAYPLINNKEAALFVIYSNKKPISICLNLVRNNTIYGYIRTYDVDYSKFYIGFTDFIKQLHWCFENGIEIFDLLKGCYPYKNKLIDTQYNFQKHVIYNTKSFLTVLSANIIVARTRAFYSLVKVLKKMNMNVFYHKIMAYKYRNRALSRLDDDSKKVSIENIPKINSNENLLKIDLNDEAFSCLKRPVYNFLYTNQDSIDAVEVFKFYNEPNSFLVKGKKQMQKITLN
ncbi:GNAT family N-acetyltransferase [Sabulilitoribacter arenilitoris]|uniref:GNAT family N-acetyltransferase n=1 Tax=Wocania arenilitoris TaxID=2044858 RepID=A0AAE3ENF0_9FLAO|nr:GNAT family N-acetyltransferase [Wocania arenilitoris]MCF7568636.1 GNAT family N-acetyltransferase [Wocania arenilitoris]